MTEFQVGERIKVVERASKHYGKKGIVKKVGKSRLTVKFDDSLTRRFVEIAFAERVVVTSLDNVSTILKNLAVTAGTIIAQEEGLSAQSCNQCVRAFTLLVKASADEYLRNVRN